MTIFQMILKLIQYFNLVPTDDYKQLTVDVKDFEDNCTETSPDKMKSLYAKAHKGMLVRLLLPFGFFFLAKYIQDMLKGEPDGFLDEPEY